MTKISKRTKATRASVDKSKKYSLKEAIEALKNAPKVKFDESVDVAFDLEIDPKDIVQPIRGTVALKHGTGKKVTVCCICKGEDEKKPKDAGAEYVGAADIIAKISDGWCDFDVCVATPDMMKDMSRLGKVLGPKGLMPNPKSGTVTTDVAKTINEVKAGKIEYKMDKQSGIHNSVGKLSFDSQKLHDNIKDYIITVITSNAPISKPGAINSIVLAKSMGPSVKLDISEFKK